MSEKVNIWVDEEMVDLVRKLEQERHGTEHDPMTGEVRELDKEEMFRVYEQAEHDHEHDHNHEHKHSHENTKAILNRMNRAIGHMESVKKMVEDGRDCSEVLIQIAAVKSAINNIGKIILEDHINNCVVDAIETGDKEVLENLNEAINKFVK